MKAIAIRFLLIIGLIVMNACDEESGPIEVEADHPKLKSMSNYNFSTSEIPGEQFLFFYDEKGRLASYDLYVPSENGQEMIHQLHFALEYKVEAPNTLYVVSVTNADSPDVIVGRRKVYLDSNSNYVRDIIYDGGGEVVLIDNVYTRDEQGFSVLSRKWLPDYNKFGITKIEHMVDEKGNVTNQKVYNSHLEGNEENEHVEFEFVMTHHTEVNPLFKLTPYFSGINSQGKYPDSDSNNNVATITPVGCDDCTTSFSYKFENGLVSEVTPGGINLFKRTFEYY
jgi:hypothetical protein